MRLLNLCGWLLFLSLLCAFWAAVAGWITASL